MRRVREMSGGWVAVQVCSGVVQDRACAQKKQDGRAPLHFAVKFGTSITGMWLMRLSASLRCLLFGKWSTGETNEETFPPFASATYREVESENGASEMVPESKSCSSPARPLTSVADASTSALNVEWSDQTEGPWACEAAAVPSPLNTREGTHAPNPAARRAIIPWNTRTRGWHWA